MDLKIRSGTVGYNNKILISDGKFSLGKNDEVNLMVPVIKSHKYSKTNSLQGLVQKRNVSHGVAHKKQKPHTVTHNEEKIAFVFLWQVVLQYGICLDESPRRRFCMGHPAEALH